VCKSWTQVCDESDSSFSIPIQSSYSGIIQSSQSAIITINQSTSPPLIPTNFSYKWNKDLYFGLTNDLDVKALQKALTLEGVYDGPVTSNFWTLTRKAVIEFQKKHNFTFVPNSGYAGPHTRKTLNNIYQIQI
ncbi:MAG: peptidoglycan-binding domain-containing protein, partial [Chloroflexota bacterium]